ncbi:MAG: response regulator transcription factor [Acholeplasmataceae bacterium]|nr:response regulator transcription factor [Acholeplasmataceae bacterium]
MINVAIVEDNASDSNLIENYLKKYSELNNVKLNIKKFDEAISFLSEYKKIYNIIFMDIEMPDINGLEAARKIRRTDKQVIIIFVTNMAQYAVKGYEVDALDFVVKPVNYATIAQKMDKALKIVRANQDAEIVISKARGFIRLPISELLYLEVTGHKIHFHTNEETVVATGSLTEYEKRLKPNNFMRCNNCYLVNPRYIKSISGMTILMKNDDTLLISHPKKKKFLMELADWLGQGNFV